jgi:hypothetical protein
LSEFLVFPAGKFDDEIDCASLIGRAIDQAHPALITERKEEKRRDRWDRDEDTSETNWKVI